MKRIVSGLLCLLLMSGCASDPKPQFKEYEAIEGEIKTIELMNVPVDMLQYQGFTDKDHVYRRTTMKESFRLLDEEASGILYFGYTTCPFCLRVVPILNDLAKKYNQTIYYVDVFSDVDPISDEDIERYLTEYVDFLEKEDGEPVFYVPQVFVIANGKVIDGHTGVVDSFDPNTQDSLSASQREELTLILESMIRVLGDEK
ncbi:MAG: hypothetical protein IJC38_05375 [Erysipelotrichaceae bacterium]|nr:hypothetical protein [Erysipelotrichaceae bacterium]